MNHDGQTSSHRSLSMSVFIAPTKRGIRFAAVYIIGCFFFSLLFPVNAVGQGDFESHLADAVHAQSVGNVSAAIVAYQSALALRRNVPEVWANLGLMQHQAGDYAGA